MALREHNSGTESDRELFKFSKDLPSLVVAMKKSFLVGGSRYFQSDVISGGLLGHLGPLHLSLGPKH